MAGKKIDELDSYGAINFDKRRKDLFEVSKNEGTYLIPEYLPGGSRKITQEELESMLGYLPLSGAKYEISKPASDGVQNGVNFSVAYASASAKAVDENNRAIVYVLVGYYDIQETIVLSPFVDIVGIGNPEDIYFDSNYGQDSIFLIEDNNLDYCISNITIANNGTPSGLSIAHDAGLTDAGKWNNVILLAPNSEDITYNGTYYKVIGGVDNVMQGSIGPDAIVSFSNFKNKSCGYSESTSVNIEGRIFDSIGIDYCFAYSSAGPATISGVIYDTKGRDGCFAVTIDDSSGADIAGHVKGCEGRDNCFSSTTSSTATVNISGLVENSKANSACFSYSSDEARQFITGSVFNCQVGGINGLVHSSPDGHKWRLTLGNDGIWQPEDIGI